MTDRGSSLIDLVYCAELVQQYLNGKTQADLDGDLTLQDAIVRRVAIVAEAARRLSDDARHELNHITPLLPLRPGRDTPPP